MAESANENSNFPSLMYVHELIFVCKYCSTSLMVVVQC